MLNVPYPYYLCSAEQCRRMDERSINEFGIDGFTLMEIAGTRAADFIELNTKTGNGLFLCGKGNNAGDALVVARLLSQQGYTVSVRFIAGTEDLSQDTQKNLALLQKLEGKIDISEGNELKDAAAFDFVVDGMLGTGLSSDVREPFASVIKQINKLNLPVFALDLPSGLHADTGRVMGTAIEADYTLTFGALKAGFFLNQGYDHTGEVILCDLPFPNKFKEAAAYLIDEAWIQPLLRTDEKRAHKYDGGMLYMVAGSEGLTGAAILAAKSAWSTGVGAVTLITPKGLLPIYEKNLPQIIKKAVGGTEDKCFTPDHLEKVVELISEKEGSLLIGPGLGRDPETIVFTQQLLAKAAMPVIIDADALFALSQSDDWHKPEEAEWMLTPHPGELSSLLDSKMDDGFDRLVQMSQRAKSAKVTILSKGFPSMIGTSDGNAYLTGYDTRIFSRAGFGDVLAGKTAAFFIQQKNPTLACAMALLNGLRKAEAFLDEHPDEALEPMTII